MSVKRLIGDNRAVSPVIGVILMVAITVVLAAVIGMFVMGLGDGLGGSEPTASVSGTDNGGSVTFAHNGGDSVDASALHVVDSHGKTAATVSGDTFGAGQTIDSDTHSAGTVSLVYDDGESSVTLATIEGASQGTNYSAPA